MSHSYDPNNGPRFIPNDGSNAGPGYGPNYGPGYGPPAGPPAEPPKKRKRGKGCLGLVLGVVVLFIIIGVIAGIAGSGSSNSGSTAASSPSTGTSPSSAPAQAAAKPATVGTPVRDGKFQFTITSVSEAKSVGDTADGLGDTAQGEYTILHVTVKNIGTEAQTFDDGSQYVYDATGRKYDASTDADMDLNSSDGADSVFLNDINPGNTVQGQLAFDMPSGTKAVRAELHDSAFSGGVTVSLP